MSKDNPNADNDFDKAMRGLVGVPKTEVKAAERAYRKRRAAKKQPKK